MDIAQVGGFASVVLLLALTPGGDWAYFLGVALRGGPVAAAVGGLVAGYGVHALLVAGGVAAAVAASPAVLTGLTVAGAAYLVWLGATALLRPGEGPAAAATPDAAPAGVWLRGMGVSALNPKGLLVFLSLLPQFVAVEAPWPVGVQSLALGALHTVVCFCVYLCAALLARRTLRRRPRAARAVTRVSGVAMLAIGVWLLAERLLG